MWILKKLITPFILPPGFFIVLLILSGFLLWRCKFKKYASFTVAIALLIWSFSISPVSNFLMEELESDLTIPLNVKGDVIILLGGGIHEGVPDLSGRGTPSEDMLARMATAVRVHHKLHVPIIISGGSVFSGMAPEAPVIRRFLLDFGVMDDDILLESQSRDTNENALFSQRILTRYGFKSPLLVTSAYHMRRSLQAFNKIGLEVTPVPAQFVAVGAPPAIWASFLPNAGALMRTSTALKEYLGLIFYTFSSR
jgi:uncharacterized SAM-binding protein YcdF (DUF218 family)